MKTNNSMEMRASLADAMEDSVFRLAVFDAAETEGREILNQEKTLIYPEDSKPTEESISVFKKLMGKKKRTPFTWRSFTRGFSRVAVAAFIITVCFIGAMGTVSAFRLQVMNFLIQFNEAYTTFEIKEDTSLAQSGKAIINWTNTYVPTYIPEGYEMNDLSIGDNLKTIMFINGTEENGFINYMEMDSSSTLTVDTENASRMDTILIQGKEAILSIKGDVTSIVWEENGRMFLIQSTAELSETLKIAEGVKFIK